MGKRDFLFPFVRVGRVAAVDAQAERGGGGLCASRDGLLRSVLERERTAVGGRAAWCTGTARQRLGAG